MAKKVAERNNYNCSTRYNVIISANLHSLLLDLLLFDPNNSILFLQLPEGSTLSSRLQKYNYNHMVVTRKQSSSNFYNYLYYHKEQIKLKRQLFHLYQSGFQVNSIIGSDNIFCIFKHFFGKGHDVIIVEEGSANYLSREMLDNIAEQESKGRRQLYLFLLGQYKLRKYKSHGYDNAVKEIILTGMKDIPQVLRPKTRVLNLHDLWVQVSDQKRKTINDVFCLDVDMYKKVDIVLLTQPFSESALCSEDEKIDIYKKMIADCGEEKVLLKRHPREKTDYRHYLREYDNLSFDYNEIPFELMLLNNIEIKEIITVNSTAAYMFVGRSHVHIIGTKKFPCLQETLGIINEEKYVIESEIGNGQ